MSKKVLITGASGAFGKLTSLKLASKGYKVVGTMRSTLGKNEKVAKELKDAGIHLVEMDVTKEESVNKGVQKAIDYLNGIDIIINNAGIGSTGLQEAFTAEDMQKIFDVNVFGVQRVMRAILPTFRSQGKGTIVSLSSCIGRISGVFYGTYSASKWALEALAESYRNELSGYGIESCIIEPGGMPTNFLDSMLRPSDKERAAAYGEMAQVPEIALQGFQEALASNPKQRPEAIANSISDLLDLPFGKKPFRTVVDYMGMGKAIEQYNDNLHDITRQIYASFGSESVLNLNQ